MLISDPLALQANAAIACSILSQIGQFSNLIYNIFSFSLVRICLI